MMSASTEEIIFMLLEHFDHDSTLVETAHTIGRESGLYFGVRYFENLVLQGRWQDAENYLSGFTKLMDNEYSCEIYLYLRTQKYIEALDRNDLEMGLDILMKELKVLASGNENLLTELTKNLVNLTENNIREYKNLTEYTDVYSGRKNLVNQLNPLINQLPQLQGKLNFPAMNHTLRDVTERYDLKQVEQLLPKRVEFSNTSEKKIEVLRFATQFKNKIVRLSYTHAGNTIWALTSNGTHFYWKWADFLTPREVLRMSPSFFSTPTTKHYHASTRTGIVDKSNGSIDLAPMRNCLTSVNSAADLVSSFDISNDDDLLVSLSGGAISLYNLLTFKLVETWMPPLPRATCVAFYPQLYHSVFVGFDDSSIVLYHRGNHKVDQHKLYGHSKRVTSLAVSKTFNLLVSADLNAQIVVWCTITLEKLRDRRLQIQRHFVPEILSETQIQFHPNQKKFLVVNNCHLAIYEATDLDCVTKWNQEGLVVIIHATFSSNGSWVFASFVDGILAVFDSSNFYMQYKIHPSAYISSTPSVTMYPTYIAADPNNPDIFAVGFTDGDVCVIEPPLDTKW